MPVKLGASREIGGEYRLWLGWRHCWISPSSLSGLRVVDIYKDIVTAFLAESELDSLSHGQGIAHVALENQEASPAPPVRQTDDGLVRLTYTRLIELHALDPSALSELPGDRPARA